MTKFLKLTNFVLNTNDIHKIVIQPNKYLFHIMSKKMDGFSWGIGLFSLGNISSYSYDLRYVKPSTQLITK